MQEVAQHLREGRRFLRSGQWDEARRAYAAAAEAGGGAEAEEGLSWIAWYLDDGEAAVAGFERAYHAFREAGDRTGSARAAIWLAVSQLEFRGQFALASGWFERARRVLEDCARSPEHGWLALHQAAIALEGEGDAEAGRRIGAEVAQLGRSLARTDLELVAVAVEGLALVFQGDVEEGLRRLDQAAAAALSGELEEPVLAGWACCYVIYACEAVRAHERAEQWTRETQVLAERLRVRYLFRVCRIHLGGVLIGFGDWEEAERELSARTEELQATRPLQALEGLVRLGELRRRQGRHDEAAVLFARAEGHPQALLGEAALALVRGDPAAAADAVAAALRQVPEANLTARTAGLELLVEAHTALGDIARARATQAQLEAIAVRCGTAHMRAGVRYAAGLIAFAESDLTEARIAFEDAVGGYRRARSPFECVRARLALARVLVRAGRDEAGRRSAATARAEAENLGAAAEALRAAGLLAALDVRTLSADAGPLTRRECEILRLVAEGLTDGEIAARLVLSLHTVHRHMANIRTKLGSPSRAAAVAAATERGLI